MKQELGSFDGEQIRINTSLLSPDEYKQKCEHEKAHNYLTYLSTIGLLQQITKEYKGVDSSTYLYLNKRTHKIQEIVALFYEYATRRQNEVRERLIQKLNGITSEAKNAINAFLNDIDKGRFIEEYSDLIIDIGISSLSAKFEGMTIKQFFNSDPNKFLETFFRQQGISPKRKFEEIVKFCNDQLKNGVSFEKISEKISEYDEENLDFIFQNASNIVQPSGENTIFDFTKDNFDLFLFFVVESNIKKRNEIVSEGIYQIPILSKLDIKYVELSKKDGKKLLQETIKNKYMSFIVLKQYSMFKAVKYIDLIVPEYDSDANVMKPLLVNSTLESALSQNTINIVTRIPRAIKFDAFLNYFIDYVLKSEHDLDSKKYNFFILGSEPHMKEIIKEIVEKYGEKSLKFFYKDFEQGVPLISVYEARNSNIIIYSEYSLKMLKELEGSEDLSAENPDREFNVLISMYLNLLFRTDLLDRI